MDQLSEDLEKKFETLAGAISDTIENLGTILAAGDRFALDPASFEEAEEYDEDDENPEALKAFIVAFAQKQLGVHSAATPHHALADDSFYLTSQPNILLGTDGKDWWIELVPSAEIENIGTDTKRSIGANRGGN